MAQDVLGVHFAHREFVVGFQQYVSGCWRWPIVKVFNMAKIQSIQQLRPDPKPTILPAGSEGPNAAARSEGRRSGGGICVCVCSNDWHVGIRVTAIAGFTLC